MLWYIDEYHFHLDAYCCARKVGTFLRKITVICKGSNFALLWLINKRFKETVFLSRLILRFKWVNLTKYLVDRLKTRFFLPSEKMNEI